MGVSCRKREEGRLGVSRRGRTRKGSNGRRKEVGSILGGSSGGRSYIGRSQLILLHLRSRWNKGIWGHEVLEGWEWEVEGKLGRRG